MPTHEEVITGLVNDNEQLRTALAELEGEAESLRIGVKHLQGQVAERDAAIVALEAACAEYRVWVEAFQQSLRQEAMDKVDIPSPATAALLSGLVKVLANPNPGQSLLAELELTNTLYEERNKVLALIPDCPTHGVGCLPHYADWIRGTVVRLEAAEKLYEAAKPATIEDCLKWDADRGHHWVLNENEGWERRNALLAALEAYEQAREQGVGEVKE